jgi:hypothetical protein
MGCLSIGLLPTSVCMMCLQANPASCYGAPGFLHSAPRLFLLGVCHCLLLCRCLVLDSRYLPVNVISWFRAVVMDGSGKVRGSTIRPAGLPGVAAAARYAAAAWSKLTERYRFGACATRQVCWDKVQ